VADFKVGDIIDGTVTKLVNFGAFVRVRDGLEGLIHISELSHQRVAHPGDVVHEGQQLKLKIISLDSERHRLGLSLKQAEEPPARPVPEPGQAGPSAGGPRQERRPRQERAYSMSDAIQEPEGGIDNTLASAFAQVRQQLAEAEDAATATEAPAEPEAAAEAPAAEAPAAGSVEEAAAEAPAAESVEEAAAEAPAAEAPAAESVEEAAAEAIDEVVETVAADEAVLEAAAAEEIEALADAAAANEVNVEPAAEAAVEVVEAVAAVEAVEEEAAAEAIEDVVESVAADEAAEASTEATEAPDEVAEKAKPARGKAAKESADTEDDAKG
jgi:small subunit ribosomal protein S1